MLKYLLVIKKMNVFLTLNKCYIFLPAVHAAQNDYNQQTESADGTL